MSTEDVGHYCKEYDDNCEGCQPAIMDPRTGRRLPSDSPEMIMVRAFWKNVPLVQKQACHRVWCFNSRDPRDLAVMSEVAEGIGDALQRASN